MKKTPPVEETLAQLAQMRKENHAAMSEVDKFSDALMAARKETLKRHAKEIQEMRKIIRQFQTGK